MDDTRQKWNNVLNDLVNQITAISYDMWIKKLNPVEEKDGKLYLQANSSIAKQTCMSSFSYLLSQSIGQHFGFEDFVILDPTEYANYLKTSEAEAAMQVVIEEATRNTSIQSKYTFDNFVVGNSNKFVYYAASTVADNPGTKYNPLFIYGGVGLGKTHLLHAIGNYIIKNNPKLKIQYTTCEQFANDFLDTLRDKTKNIATFREKYRNLDVLLIDDIQFIAGKTSVQEEFFHTFNDLYQNNKQVIIAGDRPPKEIATLEERITSRLSMGLIQDIQSPDFETRFVILQKKAQVEKYNIDNEALVYIAEKIDSNIRELEGALTNTMFLTSLVGKVRAGVNEAKNAIEEAIEESKENITATNIIDTVCSYYSIDKTSVLGNKRNKEIADARHICIYLIADMLNLPLATIGREIFHRDHTTIMHARDKISDSLEDNERLRKDINNLKQIIMKG